MSDYTKEIIMIFYILYERIISDNYVCIFVPTILSIFIEFIPKFYLKFNVISTVE